MKKCIAIFTDFYKDEIEVKGFMTMTDKEEEAFEELLKEITWEFTYQSGEMELFYSNGEDLLSRIEFREISNEEYKALDKLFNGTFGVFISSEFLENNISELSGDDSYDEDEEGEEDY